MNIFLVLRVVVACGALRKNVIIEMQVQVAFREIPVF